MTDDRPIRVLHILGSLGHGGIETWLMNIFRRMDPARVQHEVLLMKPIKGPYEEEAERLGVKLHRAQGRGGRLAFLSRLNRQLAAGRYDVVHSHVYMFSGLVMGIAARHAVPLRIAHCHHAAITQGAGSRLEKLEHRVLRSLIRRWATLKLGISNSSIEEIAGHGWESKDDCLVLLYGFDFSNYAGADERAAELRRRLDLPRDAEVIGHVGRFVVEKNHALLLRAFAQLVRRRPSAKLILVGAGPLQPQAEALVQELGLEGSVRFAGTTNDVAAYMAMFDLFVLTSTSEGLGIVVLEAQAAGTASLIRDVVPREVDIVPDLIVRAGTELAPEQWAELMDRKLAAVPAKDRQAWEKLQQSSFGIDRCVSELQAIYAQAL